MNKYNRTIFNKKGESIEADVYDVLDAFNVTCPALAHLTKKSLCVGIRGHKDTNIDLDEIKEASIRAIELNKTRKKSE